MTHPVVHSSCAIAGLDARLATLIAVASLAFLPQAAQGQAFLYSAGSFNGNNIGIIQKFNLSATGSNVAGITGSGSTGNFYTTGVSSSPFAGLAAGASGNVFAARFNSLNSVTVTEPVRTISSFSPTGTLTSITVSGAPATATLWGIALNNTSNWLYAADTNLAGTSNGLLYRLDPSDMSILSQTSVSGSAAFGPAVNPRTGTVIAYGNSRTAPVFRNFSADLSKSATISLTWSGSFGGLTTAGSFEWAGRDSIYVADYVANRVYRFNLGGLNADGLFTSGTQDTSFGTGGFVSIPGGIAGTADCVSGLATDGQFLYVGNYRGNDLVSRYSLTGSLVQGAYLNTQTNAGGTILNTLSVYTGDGAGVWNAAAGGSWGTVNTASNWTAVGGVPGINQLYTFGDTATFGSALTASGTVALNGAQPRLGALTFNNAAASYTLASGTGSGVLSLVAGSAAGGGTASVTVTAGNHTIAAPVALTSAGDFIVSNAADTLSISGAISGGAGKGLAKLGPGRLTLAANNTFTGATQITSGVLEVGATGGINTSSGITLNGATAELNYNSATALSAPITFTQGTISGTGAINTAVAAGSGDILSPGNSPGAQAYTSGLAWNPGGTYVWELNSLTGVAGTNWDILNVTGGLNLSALAVGSTFNLNLVTLTGSNTAGPLGTAYVPGSSHTFALASFDTLSVPTGFSFAANSNLTSLFTIGLSGWQGTQPAVGDISVRVNSAGTGIDLVIVPEPGAIALAGIGIAAAAWATRRRRVEARSAS